ncbi:hypothetical protein Tsubulata_011132 [Turnera subulata]|uniref:Uncharacterized protein n=1 Tax=Turnera subulata TaxID=218843 RepID=A0A9Q0FG90_9ROSI|nr:hypothetical protein Tsubulata_011132 [Turnera subulata]
MMSMFSSFDALFAESFGQKVKFTTTTGGPDPAPAIEGSSTRGKLAEESVIKKSTTSGSEGNNKSSSSSPPAANLSKGSSQQQRRRRTPRFAPELDGVHCFETILPY